MNSVYFIPSLFCALINITASIFCYKSYLHKFDSLTIPFYQLLSFVLIANCIISMISYSPSYQTLLILKLYYLTLITSILTLNVYIYSITRLYKNILVGMSTIGVMLSFYVFLGDHIIAGVRLANNAFTRIEGNYYFIMQLFLFAGLTLSLLQLVVFLKNPGPNSEKRQAAAASIFIGFVPLFVIAVYILSLMFFDIDVHALIILPIGLTFLLLACSYPLLFAKILNFSIFLPFSMSWRRDERVRKLIYTKYNNIDIKQQLYIYENALIHSAYKQSKGNIKDAAKLLGISYSSFYYKLHGKKFLKNSPEK